MKKDAPAIQLHVLLDRQLYLRFKGQIDERGETLAGRVRRLIRHDVERRANEPAATS